jgi:hypothetical protein
LLLRWLVCCGCYTILRLMLPLQPLAPFERCQQGSCLLGEPFISLCSLGTTVHSVHAQACLRPLPVFLQGYQAVFEVSEHQLDALAGSDTLKAEVITQVGGGEGGSVR